jgi:hypothetical protein
MKQQGRNGMDKDSQGKALANISEKISNLEVGIPAKTSELRILKVTIHIAHAAWIVALVMSISTTRGISSYATFMPLLVFASCLEMLYWGLLGRHPVEIKGPYSHAAAIENANRDFLLFSWYVVPPFPPFRLLERYSANLPESAVRRQRSQIFARFWLKSELTPLMICALLLIYVLYPGTPPELYGLGRYFPVACLFWIVEFGLFSKLLSVLIFSTLIRLHKGF